MATSWIQFVEAFGNLSECLHMLNNEVASHDGSAVQSGQVNFERVSFFDPKCFHNCGIILGMMMQK